MTRAQLIKKIMSRMRISKYDCIDVFDIFVDEVQQCLRRGDKLVINNFMTIEPAEHPERRGRDPQSGRVITYPPYKTVKCTISQALKDAVNGK